MKFLPALNSSISGLAAVVSESAAIVNSEQPNSPTKVSKVTTSVVFAFLDSICYLLFLRLKFGCFAALVVKFQNANASILYYKLFLLRFKEKELKWSNLQDVAGMAQLLREVVDYSGGFGTLCERFGNKWYD